MDASEFWAAARVTTPLRGEIYGKRKKFHKTPLKLYIPRQTRENLIQRARARGRGAGHFIFVLSFRTGAAYFILLLSFGT